MHLLNKCVVVILAAMLSGASMAEGVTEKSDEALLQAQLEKWQHLSASFAQQASRDQGGDQTGQVWVSRPDQFRVELASPLSQTIVSDGESVWTWDVDLEQVIITELSGGVADVPVLLFAGEPAGVVSRFDVTRFELPEQQRVFFRMSPKDDASMLKEVSLVFDGGSPSGIGVTTTMGDETWIELQDVSTLAVDVSRYQFTIPEHADVIDDRP